jgi:SAM-dependent methyltransferase
MVSSDANDCVLDPFSGSGTTETAAYQLGRNYVGIEISPQYVEKANERLSKLERQHQSLRCLTAENLFLDTVELNELRQLLSDMKRPAQEILADKNLLKIFTNQFSVRMNNQKHYRSGEIVTALKDLAD